VENATAGRIGDADIAQRVSDALRARCGVKPANVIVLPDGTLERSTHKAKRVIDERVVTKASVEPGQ
jgi:phenylacetate-CoA ligase